MMTKYTESIGKIKDAIASFLVPVNCEKDLVSSVTTIISCDITPFYIAKVGISLSSTEPRAGYCLSGFDITISGKIEAVIKTSDRVHDVPPKTFHVETPEYGLSTSIAELIYFEARKYWRDNEKEFEEQVAIWNGGQNGS